MRATPPTRAAARPRALPLLFLVVLAVAVQLLFLAGPERPGFPLDDAWIHATYARNLARHGELALNPGQPSTGTTSFLWTALLAAGHALVGRPILVPLLLGLAAQAALVACVYLLSLDATGDGRVALLAAVSCALLGNLVWIGLSGMEATLFVALGLWAVWCRGRGRPAAAGLLAGLVFLTRPEGGALALAMGLLELWRAWSGREPRRRWTTWAALLAPTAAAAALYATINLLTTGQLLTATFAGRRWLAGQPAHISISPMAVAGRLGLLVGAWAQYLQRWVFGAVLLGAWMGVGRAFEAAAVGGVAVALAALLGMVCLLRGGRREGNTSHRASRRHGGEERAQGPFERGTRGGENHGNMSGWRRQARWSVSAVGPLLLLWAAGHNAAYVLLLPAHGHAGRYQAINFVLLAMLVAVGFGRLARARGGLRRVGQLGLALWLALALGSALLWRVIYRDCVDHINRVHAECGRWIAEHLPADAVVATYDLGAVAYFANRRIVDLGGLVDPAMARALFAGDAVPYLRKRGATHFAMVQHAPGDFRLAVRLGLHPPAPSRPALVPLEHAAWGIPLERYRLHHPATSNAMPRITLYRLLW